MAKYTLVKYIRLSVDDGISESLSIPNQRLILDRHIEELGIDDIEVLEMVDNGYTGTNMERPAVQELLEIVRSGGVNCICVKDFSRFSRNSMDSGYFIEQVFPLYGVRFISVSDNFDSDDYKNDTGGIDVAFKFLMHEYYSKDLSVKVKSALHMKKLNGEHVSGIAPYGYVLNEADKYEPEPETAEIVRLIFKLALEGNKPTAIRDTLFQSLIPTPKERIDTKRGKPVVLKYRWDAQTIIRILSDERYTGTYISGKFEKVAVGSKNMIETDPSQWIVIPGNHPALVSKEDFDRVGDTLLIKGSKAVKENQNGNLAKRRVKKDGSAIGIFPLYGYVFDENRKPVISPKPAEAIRQVFQMTLDGKPVPQICEALTQAGYPTPGEQKAMDRGEVVNTKKAWTRGAVRGIQRELQYTGTAVSGRSIIAAKMTEGAAKPMTPRYAPQSEWRLTPNARPAIISEETFNAVQEVLANQPKRSNTVRNYLLKNIGRCGCCGHALGYDDGVGYPLYRCKHTVGDPSATCHKMKFVANDIDCAILDVIRKTAEVILATTALHELSPKGDFGKQRSDYSKRIIEYSEQRQQYYESFITGKIDREEYLSLKTVCSEKIDDLNRKVAALNMQERAKDDAQELLELVNRSIDEAIPHKDVVDTLIEKVHVFPDRQIEIEWKIADFALANLAK